jgi:hypothetical protein
MKGNRVDDVHVSSIVQNTPICKDAKNYFHFSRLQENAQSDAEKR